MMTESRTIDVLPSPVEAESTSDDDPGPSPAGVVVLHDAWRELPVALATVHEAVNAATAFVPALAESEVAVALSSDAAVRELNARFRGQDKPTNVLSFPAVMSPGPGAAHASGDVIIAYETLRREADAEGKDPLHHLAHLTVHGLLHLAGYDHDDDAEAEVMEALERRILGEIGIADPYRSELEEDQQLETAETR